MIIFKELLFIPGILLEKNSKFLMAFNCEGKVDKFLLFLWFILPFYHETFYLLEMFQMKYSISVFI